MVDSHIPQERCDFYVYVIFRPDGTPCYVGKGKGGRWQQHIKKASNPNLKRIYANANGDVPVVKVREGLTDEAACQVEIAFIAAIGRKKHGGPLVNFTNGGGGTSGYKRTSEQLANIALYWKSPEGIARKERLAVRASAYALDHPEWIAKTIARNKSTKPTLGKAQPPEWRIMIGSVVSESNRRRETTEITRKIRSENMRAMWMDGRLGKVK